MSFKPNATPALPSPWREFLEELDKLLPSAVELHCLGGFVLTALYGLPRPTGDIDYISAVPLKEVETVAEIAGPDSRLARKYKVRVHYVTIADVPENYEARLREMFPGQFSKLRLFALDPHDIVLSKVTRNSSVDDDDVRFLAKAGVLDPAVLRERYEREFLPIGDKKKHDLTLQLWLEDYFPKDQSSGD
ncbi:MAG: DUF6036 family nucleotidyltransferase [Nitrospiraceae bacterium]